MASKTARTALRSVRSKTTAVLAAITMLAVGFAPVTQAQDATDAPGSSSGTVSSRQAPAADQSDDQQGEDEAQDAGANSGGGNDEADTPANGAGEPDAGNANDGNGADQSDADQPNADEPNGPANDTEADPEAGGEENENRDVPLVDGPQVGPQFRSAPLPQVVAEPESLRALVDKSNQTVEKRVDFSFSQGTVLQERSAAKYTLPKEVYPGDEFTLTVVPPRMYVGEQIGRLRLDLKIQGAQSLSSPTLSGGSGYNSDLGGCWWLNPCNSRAPGAFIEGNNRVSMYGMGGEPEVPPGDPKYGIMVGGSREFQLPTISVKVSVPDGYDQLGKTITVGFERIGFIEDHNGNDNRERWGCSSGDAAKTLIVADSKTAFLPDSVNKALTLDDPNQKICSKATLDAGRSSLTGTNVREGQIEFKANGKTIRKNVDRNTGEACVTYAEIGSPKTSGTITAQYLGAKSGSVDKIKPTQNPVTTNYYVAQEVEVALEAVVHPENSTDQQVQDGKTPVTLTATITDANDPKAQVPDWVTVKFYVGDRLLGEARGVLKDGKRVAELEKVTITAADQAGQDLDKLPFRVVVEKQSNPSNDKQVVTGKGGDPAEATKELTVSEPIVTKQAEALDGVENGQRKVKYTIAVNNGEGSDADADGSWINKIYSLFDEMTASEAAKIVKVEWKETTAGSTQSGVVDGDEALERIKLDGLRIQGGKESIFEVVMTYEASDVESPDTMQCESGEGAEGKVTGLRNNVKLTTSVGADNAGEKTSEAEACAPVVADGYVVLQVQAVDSEGNPLTHVDGDFTIFEADPNDSSNVKDPTIVTNNGQTYYQVSLKPGTKDNPRIYNVIQQRVNEGDSLLVAPVQISVWMEDGVAKVQVGEGNDGIASSQNGDEYVPENLELALLKIADFKRAGTLPKTGGSGIYLPAALGLLLVIAGAAYASRRNVQNL